MDKTLLCPARRTAIVPLSRDLSAAASSHSREGPRTTVFYDGKCGLCSKEINYYKRIAPAGVFTWRDVARSPDDLEKEGISQADGLRLLHAKDEAGRMHVGVDAFILIWSRLAGQWRLAALYVSFPPVKLAARVAYRVFANWRFKRLDHCQLALKKKS